MSSRSGSLSPPLDSHPTEHEPTRQGEETSPGSDTHRTPTTEQLAPGAHVGRYMILGRLGAGAMGVVFTAWDPELDRKIALKLLHSRADASIDNRARLLREAKSLARLSHPNVIAVHDVGTIGDRVFLAMEFVAGRTLTTWLKEQPRRWPDIVAVLRRAGEGLAAAHDAGLVHRDLKPDNILIGDDGRVRVLDFGLARAAGEAPESLSPDAEEAVLVASASQPQLPDQRIEEELHTRTGALVGTPAYMSPEQHLGRAADARSDQFSFCVTLYQALYGVRPFTATKLSSLAFQIIQGKVEAAPAGAQVPAWLRKVVLRGLSTEADARYPTMRALLADLDRDRRVARRSGGFVAGLGGLALAVSLWQRVPPAAEPPCRGAQTHLAGVWDDARKLGIEQAFDASNLPYAPTVWASTRRALDAYAGRWVDAHNEACEATLLRHELSEEARDRRMRCLDRRRASLGALTEALLHANASTIEHVSEAIPTLADLATCEDDEALEALVPPPDDPAKVDAIEATISEAAGLELSGDLDAASNRAHEAVGAAEALRYDPVLSEALRARAKIQQRLGRHEVASASLGDAIVAAARGRDDHAAALAWIDLVYHTGVNQPEAARLEAYLRAAEERLVRSGDDPVLHAILDLGHAAGLQRLGHDEEALQVVSRALTPLERDPTASPARLSNALNLLGLIQHRRDHLPEARAAYLRSLEVAEGYAGRMHPTVATVLINLAEVELEAGNPADAERLAREADKVRRAVLPEGHIDRADSAQTLAHLAEQRGEFTAAEGLYLDALATFNRQPNRDPLHLGILYNDMGTLASTQDQLERAHELFTAALAAFRETAGPDSLYARTAASNLAEVALWRGRPDEALPPLARILPEIEREAPGGDDAARAHTLLAQTQLARKEIPAAVQHAEQAVKIVEAGASLEEPLPAIARATLATSLAAAGPDHKRIKLLAMVAEPELLKAVHEAAARRALAALRNLQTR